MMQSEIEIERLVGFLVGFAKKRGVDITTHAEAMKRIREDAARANAEWHDAEDEIAVPMFAGIRDGEPLFLEARMSAKKLAEVFSGQRV